MPTPKKGPGPKKATSKSNSVLKSNASNKKTTTSYKSLQNTSSALKKNANKPVAKKSSSYRGLDERSKADLKASSKKMGDRVAKPSSFDKAAYDFRVGSLQGFGATKEEAINYIKQGGLGSNVARSKKK
jgi:hypothetical protein